MTKKQRVYEAVPEWTRAEAEASLASGDPSARRHALLSIAFYDADWRYAQETCLRYVDEPDVSEAAVISLGHIARVHQRIDYERIVPVLQRIRRGAGLAAGNAYHALTDIRQFVPASRPLIGNLE